MTNSDKQDHLARLTGEYERCQRQVAATESELKRIGVAFVALGNRLQTAPASIPPERLTVEKDLAVLWLILPEYIQALQTREAKKAEMDSLK